MFVQTILCLLLLVAVSSQNPVQDAFKKFGIIPIDVLPVAPERLLEVTYANGLQVNLGNELKPSEVKDEPTVVWKAENNDFYTLVMTDPDAPSRQDPAFREIKHWLVLNIRGNDLSTGRTIAAYRGSGPPPNSGLHRYIFLVYKQPALITDEMPIASKDSRNGRIGFKIQDFASKYNLGIPMYGNFFQAQNEENKKG